MTSTDIERFLARAETPAALGQRIWTADLEERSPEGIDIAPKRSSVKIVDRWCTSFAKESSSFKSFVSFAEIRLREAVSCSDYELPNAAVAAVFVDLLGRLPSCFGRYSDLLELLNYHVRKLVYCNLDDDGKRSPDARACFASTPYFDAFHNLKKQLALAEQLADGDDPASRRIGHALGKRNMSIEVRRIFHDIVLYSGDAFSCSLFALPCRQLMFSSSSRMLRRFIFNAWRTFVSTRPSG